MTTALLLLTHFSLLVSVYCYTRNKYDPLQREFNIPHFTWSTMDHGSNKDIKEKYSYLQVYVGLQDGLKDDDKISILPGQPTEINFEQYSGYVTIDPNHGKALFYYFVQSPINFSTNPLVVWFNGGPGCSSFGGGALRELGPFRVNPDKKTLSRNKYSWNNVANVLFLESPVGVGFSYSNTSSDYETGDSQTAKDSYTFLVNWLERFQEYKTRDVYIAGQSYAGHFIPQLAQLILQNNKHNNQTVINLKGIALGNPLLDLGTQAKGSHDYFWSHAIISGELHAGITSKCNFSEGAAISWKCRNFMNKAYNARGNIHPYDIYAPLCLSHDNGSPSILGFDPCSQLYISEYLNNPVVQQSIHAKLIQWHYCNDFLTEKWKDSPYTVLPVVKDVMASGINVWIYSGDTDAVCPVTSTRYDIQNLQISVKTPWYPWMYEGEVGGYVVGYENLTFVTIRGAGQSVPSYQPARALAFFTSFLEGKLP